MKTPTCVTCDGKCCYFAPMSKREFKTIRKKYGVPKGAKVVESDFKSNLTGNYFTMVTMPDGRCAYYKDGKCSVYEIRPMVCRLMGTDKLPCPLQSK